MVAKDLFASRLLDWFDAHARALPWRETRDPYAILVSEVEWQGLGYNRRALNLHRAARSVAQHGWPDDLTELPGVGPYTAAAIGNFALGHDVLPLDTNVRRVQERTGASFDASCAQALFDLGATICLARVPRCGECPVASACPSRG